MMATPLEALDAMIDEQTDGGFITAHKKPRVLAREKGLIVKQLIRFLENVDEDLTVLEVRQALEEVPIHD